MKIRKYKDRDEEQVKKLISKVLTEFFGKNVIEKWEDFGKYVVFYVAEDSGKIVGASALSDNGNNTGKLKRMYIYKKYRNKGLGQKLLENIIKSAKENNFNRLILSTEQRLVGAINFYKKNGFKEIRSDWEKDHSELKNEYVNINRMKFMEKKL